MKCYIGFIFMFRFFFLAYRLYFSHESQCFSCRLEMAFPISNSFVTLSCIFKVQLYSDYSWIQHKTIPFSLFVYLSKNFSLNINTGNNTLDGYIRSRFDYYIRLGMSTARLPHPHSPDKWNDDKDDKIVFAMLLLISQGNHRLRLFSLVFFSLRRNSRLIQYAA